MNSKSIGCVLKRFFNTADDKVGKRLLNSIFKGVVYGGLCYIIIICATWILSKIYLVFFPNGDYAINIMNIISTGLSIICWLSAILILLAHMIIKETFYLYNTTKTSYLKDGLPGKAGTIAKNSSERINQFNPEDEK